MLCRCCFTIQLPLPLVTQPLVTPGTLNAMDFVTSVFPHSISSHLVAFNDVPGLAPVSLAENMGPHTVQYPAVVAESREFASAEAIPPAHITTAAQPTTAAQRHAVGSSLYRLLGGGSCVTSSQKPGNIQGRITRSSAHAQEGQYSTGPLGWPRAAPDHYAIPYLMAEPQVSLLQQERETQGHPSLNLCGLPKLHKAQQLPSVVINHAAVSAVTLQCKFTFTTGHIPHCSRMPILTNKRSS